MPLKNRRSSDKLEEVISWLISDVWQRANEKQRAIANDHIQTLVEIRDKME